jgi:MoaA/NifB/PqqE/SkfB family radical SAM enzyme
MTTRSTEERRMKIVRDELSGTIIYDDETLSYRLVEKGKETPVKADRIVTRNEAVTREDILSGPIRIYYEFTRRCNLQCRHCFASCSPKGKAGLSTESVKALLEDMKKAGVINIRFTGGEPTFRDDWYEVFSYARDLGFVVSLSTNGVFADTQATVARIARLGLEQVTISIDGTEKIHDRLRGTGAFNASLSSLRQLRDTVKNLRITTVLTRLNIGDIPALVKLAGNYVNVINFVCMRPIGKASRNRSLMLDFEEHHRSAEMVKELQSDYPDLLIIHSDLPLPAMWRVAEEGALMPLREALAYGNTALFAAADGSIWPHHYSAHQTSRFRLGIFPHDSIGSIWAQSEKLDGFRAWNRAIAARCRECGESGRRCAGINFEMEVARFMGRIDNNPYCNSPLPSPSPWDYIH